MPEPDSDKTLLPCDRCSALVDSYDAQAATVDHKGRYTRWAHGRAAFEMRNRATTDSLLKYLCVPCSKKLFGRDAQTDAQRDQASGKGDQ